MVSVANQSNLRNRTKFYWFQFNSLYKFTVHCACVWFGPLNFVRFSIIRRVGAEEERTDFGWSIRKIAGAAAAPGVSTPRMAKLRRPDTSGLGISLIVSWRTTSLSTFFSSGSSKAWPSSPAGVTPFLISRGKTKQLPPWSPSRVFLLRATRWGSSLPRRLVTFFSRCFFSIFVVNMHYVMYVCVL